MAGVLLTEVLLVGDNKLNDALQLSFLVVVQAGLFSRCCICIQFKLSKLMRHTSSPLLNFPSWESSIVNCTPFVVAEPSALPEQPEQPEQPALPDPVEDWMTSATAPVDNNDTQVVVICYFDKSVATASMTKQQISGPRSGFLDKLKSSPPAKWL